MVADEEEAVGPLFEPVGDDAPAEDVSQYFWRESGYV